MNEPWAALKYDFALEPTGELDMKKVKGKWGLERCSVRAAHIVLHLYLLTC
jgi:hypothetical protein